MELRCMKVKLYKNLVIMVTMMIALNSFACTKKNSEIDSEAIKTQLYKDSSIQETYNSRVKWSVVSRLAMHNNKPFVEDDKVLEFIEKKYNADIEFIPIYTIDHEEYKRTLNKLLASGVVPDIINIKNNSQGLSAKINQALFENNMVINISELLKSNKNKWPLIEKDCYHEEAVTFLHTDNNLYCIPRFFGIYPHAIMYRQDWLEKANLEPPEDINELVDMLRVFVKNDYDGQKTTGWSFHDTWWLNHLYAGIVGTVAISGFEFNKEANGTIQNIMLK